MNAIDDELLEGLVSIPSVKTINLCAIALSEKQAKILASSQLEEIWVTQGEVKKVIHELNANPNLSIMIPPADQENQEYARKTTRNAMPLLLSKGYSITNSFNPNSSTNSQNNDMEQQEETNEKQPGFKV